MVQVKKEAIRQRILDAAAILFEEKGFIGCTVGDIAKRAGISASSVYVYYASKLEICFEVFTPLVAARFEEMISISAGIKDHRHRLTFILTRYWRDWPVERGNYIRSLLQAQIVYNREEGYDTSMYFMTRDRLGDLLFGCLPDDRKPLFDKNALAHLVIMAFDGFAMNGHLPPDQLCSEELIEGVCNMMLGPKPPLRRRPG
jgi:AcrR family transcriptional regulator